MVADHWRMVVDHGRMVADHWRMVVDHWRMVADHWRMVVDHWRMVVDHWRMVADHWRVVADHWRMVADHWCMVVDHWRREGWDFVRRPAIDPALLSAGRAPGYHPRMAPPSDDPFRILLVEDEPIIRELVRTMLEEQGVEVSCVGDGSQAVKRAREVRPSLVLLDIVLPGMDGITACRFLRAEPFMEGVPIYMLTARVKAQDHEASRRAGADGHIEKPFKGTELMELVQRLRDARAG